MKRILAGGLLAAVTLLGGLAFTNGSAAATVDNEQPEVCYETESFVEYQYRKTVTTPAVEEVSHVEYRWDIETRQKTYGDVIEKETRTKTSDNWGITWTDYGPWTDWPDAGPVNDDGRNRGPAEHGKDLSGREQWYRQYRYVVVGQYQTGFTGWTSAGSTDWGLSDTPPADTETTRYVNKQSMKVITVEAEDAFDTTYYYTGSDPSTSIEDAIWTEGNPGAPWEQFNKRDNERRVEVECPPPPTTAPPTTQPPATTTPPPTTAPPTTESPTTTTTVPPVITTTVPPTVPPTVAPTLPPPPPPAAPTELPKTGAETWYMVLIGLLMLAGGSGLIYATRRS